MIYRELSKATPPINEQIRGLALQGDGSVRVM